MPRYYFDFRPRADGPFEADETGVELAGAAAARSEAAQALVEHALDHLVNAAGAAEISMRIRETDGRAFCTIVLSMAVTTQ